MNSQSIKTVLAIFAFAALAAVTNAVAGKTSGSDFNNDNRGVAPKSSAPERLPMVFTTGENGRFFSLGGGYGISLTPDGAELHVISSRRADNGSTESTRGRVGMRFVGASSTIPYGEAQLGGKVNFLYGSDPDEWKAELPTYSRVRYDDVYAGIDAVFYGNQNELEYDFVVAPGARPEVIGLEFDGAKSISIDRDGNLLIRLANGQIIQRRPIAHQMFGGVRKEVSVRFVKRSSGRIGFRLGKYDRRQELVIDPAVIFATYWGGNSLDNPASVRTDSDGNIYVVGWTLSLNFPTVNPIQPSTGSQGSLDAFVTKFNPSATAVIYSTFLGGNSDDLANAVRVDANGNAVISGRTFSTNFPTAGPLQAQYAGSGDGFVAKLSPNGSALLYSTYFGGLSSDDILGLDIDDTGRIVIGGLTESVDFPTVGAFRPNIAGNSVFRSTDGGTAWSGSNPVPNLSQMSTVVSGGPNATGVLYGGTARGVIKSIDGGASWQSVGAADLFVDVTRVFVVPTNPDVVYAIGGFQLWKSVNGGTNWTLMPINSANPTSVAVDPANTNRIYVGDFSGLMWRSVDNGATWSSATLPNAFTQVQSLAVDPANPQTVYAGTTSRFYRTTNGGDSWTNITNGFSTQNFFEIFCDSASGAVYTSGDFGLFKSTNGGTSFSTVPISNTRNRGVVRDPANASRLYSVTASGLVYTSADAGGTWSAVTGAGLNTLNVRGIAMTSNVIVLGTSIGSDGFVAAISASGQTLEYSSFYGGFGNDQIRGVDVGGDGLIVFGGTTSSPDLPVANAVQPALGGFTDAFAGKLNANGTGLIYGTYLGGSFNDNGFGVAADSSGAAYIAGSTFSANFPVNNAFQPTCISCASSLSDAFLTKISATGNTRVYSTFLGGTLNDSANAIAIDALNRPVVGGATTSNNFPVIDAVRPTIGGGTDGFVSQFRADGSGLVYSTYYGGSGTDQVLSIAVSPDGNVLAFGSTTSANFPTFSPIQATYGGSTDTFLVKIGISADLRLTAAEERDPVMVDNPLVVNLQIFNAGPQAATNVVLSQSIPVGLDLVSVVPSQGNCTTTAGVINCAIGQMTANATVTARIVYTPRFAGTAINSFTVSANESDPVISNNSVAVTTQVSALPSIFGRIATSSGQPATNVNVAIEGLVSRTTVTDANGGYAFAELTREGSYLVRPSRPGYFFAPRSRSFAGLAADGTADFVMSQCSYSLSATAFNIGAVGGSGTVFLTTNDQFCDWSATSSAPWLTITSAASGIGNTAVKFSVASSNVRRSATLTIGGSVYTVTQDGCSVVMTPTQQSFLAAGGSGTFEVRTSESICQWTAAPSAPWVSINGANSGTGNGTVSYTIAPAAQARRARIDVGSKSVAIYQESDYCANPTLSAPILGNGAGTSNDIVAAKLNADSYVDLATADTPPLGNGTFSTYLVSGSGVPVRNSIQSTVGATSQIVAADFNQDSTIDLAIRGNSANIATFANNGAGAFTLLSTTAGPQASLTGMFAGDYNSDGKADLAMATGDRIVIYNGTGNGSFTVGTSQLYGTTGVGVTDGDFNGDGFADFAVIVRVDSSNTRLKHFFGNGSGGLIAGGDTQLTVPSSVVKSGDLNGDGKDDLVFDGFASGSVIVMLWQPSINAFGSPTRILTAVQSASLLRVVDFDHDGKLDIVSTNSLSFGYINVLRGNGNGTFRSPRSFPSPQSVTAFTTADINNDGFTDIAVARQDTQIAYSVGGCSLSAGRAATTTPFDFDGDRRADLAVVRPDENAWFIAKNGGWDNVPFGRSEDIAVPADYDGDGRTDIAVFRPAEGRWYRIGSNDGAVTVYDWGMSGDIPAVADFDGDERADFAVFRPRDQIWYWTSSISGERHAIRFGLTTDVPVPADYDGDGKADIAVFRRSDATWYWRKSSTGAIESLRYGLATDIPVPADYDGDGLVDQAIFRGSTGVWYVMKSSRRDSEQFSFGSTDDRPAPADYDGDGKADPAVFRQGEWFVLLTSSGTTRIERFGKRGDVPVPALQQR